MFSVFFLDEGAVYLSLATRQWSYFFLGVELLNISSLFFSLLEPHFFRKDRDYFFTEEVKRCPRSSK